MHISSCQTLGVVDGYKRIEEEKIVVVDGMIPDGDERKCYSITRTRKALRRL